MTDYLPVSNLFVDLYATLNNTSNSMYDFEVVAIYVDPRHYQLSVRRLDQSMGWNIYIEVMEYDFKHESRTFVIPTTDAAIYTQVIEILPDRPDLIPASTTKNHLSGYQMAVCPEPQAISRTEFNAKFETDIVVLPKLVYAVGIDVDGQIYMYNEKYDYYSETIYQNKFICSVWLTHCLGQKKYYLFAGNDGYMDERYQGIRKIPKQIGETDFINEDAITNATNEDEYWVLHSKKCVLTQCQLVDMDYVIGVPDRHYFLCNLYNPFRSIHRGIPFSQKISKVVYGGRYERGNRFNFVNRRDIELGQRYYFLSYAVDKKDFIHFSSTQWIDSTEMVQYKYILDIDGRASTWDGTAWKLNSGSVLLKTKSHWRQWFYYDFLPWIHYVPIATDFSDLREKYEWCESHPEECEIMIRNCLELFQTIYRFQNAVEYTKNVLQQI